MPRVKKRSHAQNSAMLQRITRRLETVLGDFNEIALNSKFFEDTTELDKLKSRAADLRNDVIAMTQKVDLHKL